MATEEQNVNPRLDDEAALNEEASRELAAMVAEEESAAAMDAETPDEGPLSSPQSQAERAAVVEALIYVSEEPLSAKHIADVLKERSEERRVGKECRSRRAPYQ